MDFTNNYNLKKPAEEDFYNIEDFNDNADIIDDALQNKVDKETGKGLSEANFTTAEKAKLTNLDTALNAKANKATSPTNNNLAALTADGDIKDSGAKISDFATNNSLLTHTNKSIGANDEVHGMRYVDGQLQHYNPVGMYWLPTRAYSNTKMITNPFVTIYKSGTYVGFALNPSIAGNTNLVFVNLKSHIAAGPVGNAVDFDLFFNGYFARDFQPSDPTMHGTAIIESDTETVHLQVSSTSITHMGVTIAVQYLEGSWLWTMTGYPGDLISFNAHGTLQVLGGIEHYDVNVY